MHSLTQGMSRPTGCAAAGLPPARGREARFGNVPRLSADAVFRGRAAGADIIAPWTAFNPSRHERAIGVAGAEVMAADTIQRGLGADHHVSGIGRRAAGGLAENRLDGIEDRRRSCLSRAICGRCHHDVPAHKQQSESQQSEQGRASVSHADLQGRGDRPQGAAGLLYQSGGRRIA